MKLRELLEQIDDEGEFEMVVENQDGQQQAVETVTFDRDRDRVVIEVTT